MFFFLLDDDQLSFKTHAPVGQCSLFTNKCMVALFELVILRKRRILSPSMF